MVFKKLIPKAKLTDTDFEAEISFQPERGTPEGRYPIADGWYRTPEVIDPRDPVNYPDSPFNGGNPLSTIAFGMDIKLRGHPCGADLSVQNTFAFFKLPIGGLSYRFPGKCRNENEAPPPPPEPGIPLNPGSKASNFDADWGVTENTYCYVVLGKIMSQFTNYLNCDGKTFSPNAPSFEKRTGSPPRCPPEGATFKAANSETVLAEVEFDRIEGARELKSEVFTCPPLTSGGNPYLMNRLVPGGNTNLPPLVIRWSQKDRSTASGTEVVSSVTHKIYQDASGRYLNSLEAAPYPHETIRWAWIPTGRIGQEQLLCYGRWGLIKGRMEEAAKTVQPDYYTEYICQGVLDPLSCKIDPYAKNPPPPPDDKDECCMECCSQTNQTQDDNSDLLRRILKKVENVENRLGCQEYPFNVPASLIQRHEGFLASLLPKPTKKIDNEQQFLRWIFEAFEEIIGQWEVPIEIKDSDPTTPGEQPQGIKLINIAEGFAELTAIGANASINTEVLINMGTRLLYELAAARQTTADTNAKTQALIEFFGFKTKDEKDFMEMTFTTGKDRLDETLKESQQQVLLTKFDDPKKSYKQDMAALLSAAGVIKAVFTKKVKGGDLAGTKAAIASLIRDTAKAQEKSKSSLSKKLEEDFETWCESFERGWSEEIVQDPNGLNEPWGEPFAERPKVVKIIKAKPPTETK